MSYALQTERLALAPLAPDAAAALLNDREEATKLIGTRLSEQWPAPDLLDVLPAQAATTAELASFGVWLIIEQSSATVIGDIGFFGPANADGSVEIGYSIVPDRRRHGYATEAARALIDWASTKPEVRMIVAGCLEENEPSIRVLERLAFSRTGNVDNEIRWRLAPRSKALSV